MLRLAFRQVTAVVLGAHICTISSLSAQTTNTNACLAILDNDYYIYRDILTVEDRQQFDQVMWCRRDYQSEQSASEAGLNMEFIYEGIGIELQSEDRYQKALEKKSEYCGSILSTSRDQYYQSISERYPNVDVIKHLTTAYNQCLDLRASGAGLKCIANAVGSHLFTFSAWYSPVTGGDKATVTSFDITGGTRADMNRRLIGPADAPEAVLGTVTSLPIIDAFMRLDVASARLLSPANPFGNGQEVLYQGIATSIRREDPTIDLSITLNTDRGSCVETSPGAAKYTVAVSRLEVEGDQNIGSTKSYRGWVNHSQCKRNVVSPIHSELYCLEPTERFLPETVRTESPKNGGFNAGAGGSAEFCFRAVVPPPPSTLEPWAVNWSINDSRQCVRFYAPVLQCGADTGPDGNPGYYPGGSPPCRWALGNGTAAYLHVDVVKSDHVTGRPVSTGQALTVSAGGTANFALEKSLYSDLSNARFHYDINVSDVTAGRTIFLRDGVEMPGGYVVSADPVNGILSVTVPN